MAADRQKPTVTLARYTDAARRPHRVVLRGALVLDLAAGRPARVLARLSEGEGERQARALLDGSEIDEGYLARARREARPFVRTLSADDLRPATADPQDGRDEAAGEPPLAA